MTITGHVNNIIVRSQLVTLTRDQTLRGVKTFFGNITVIDDQLSCGTLNSEAMPAFRDDMVRNDGGRFEIGAAKVSLGRPVPQSWFGQGQWCYQINLLDILLFYICPFCIRSSCCFLCIFHLV